MFFLYPAALAWIYYTLIRHRVPSGFGLKALEPHVARPRYTGGESGYQVLDEQDTELIGNLRFDNSWHPYEMDRAVMSGGYPGHVMESGGKAVARDDTSGLLYGLSPTEVSGLVTTSTGTQKA